jgi:hypothetical protein
VGQCALVHKEAKGLADAPLPPPKVELAHHASGHQQLEDGLLPGLEGDYARP